MSAAERLPRPDLSALSEEHQHMLLVESGNSREVAEARGSFTAYRRSDLPAGFKEYQSRSFPAWVSPRHSPDEVTTGYQLRPKTPRKDKRGKPIKYESSGGSSSTLDVNPLMRQEVREGTGDLYVTEGVKKVDALASWGLPAVGIIGVWNFAVKGSKGTKPLPCWRHVKLRGRRVVVVYDADAKTNANVQEALRRLVAMLERLGAVVLVVYLPPVNSNNKAGVDDWKAAGGTRDALRRMARPFEPVDVGTIRLSGDEKLRAANEYLWAEWREMPARKMAECTDRAVMRDLTGQVPKVGKLEDGGVLVPRSIREIAKGAQTSLGAVTKSIDRLEASGRLRRAFWGRAKDKPGAYLLFTPGVKGRALREQEGSEGAHYGGGAQGDKEAFSLASAEFDRGVHVTRAPSDEIPPLRWPKVVLTWERVEGRRVVVDSYYVARLGKRREEIMRHVLEAGGDSTVGELLERFGARTTRARDFRNRMLGPIVAEGIFTVVGEDVALTDGWRAALEEARERTEEIKDARLQAAKYERQKESYRAWLASEIKPDPTPERMDRAEWRRMLKAAERDEAARLEEQRRKVGTTVETFVHDEIQKLGRLRFGLLRELWTDRGGNPAHVMPAVRKLRCSVERLPEHGNALFVFPPAKGGNSASVVPLRLPEETELETVVDSGSHDLSCDCEECITPAPRYARPWRSA
ncbi:MAG: DUF3854 domain-containing protein [Actinomycetota bacterium]|nr:DUF3854 domain-containing protein [Actinomycetota bacterium]